ncbi:MAG: hypothetical protein ACO3RV_05805 [Luteolibacter sp.]
MRIRLLAVLGLWLCLFSPAVWAMGSRKEKASVSFHLEALAEENPKMIFQHDVAGAMHTFRRLPDFSIKDMAAFTPFEDANGELGIVFRVKSRAVNRLAALTGDNPDQLLLAVVNGRPVDAVRIDRQIRDGVLVVWKGVSLQDIELLDEVLPRAGDAENKKKKR